MILYTADFHLHNWAKYSRLVRGGINSRLYQQLESLMGMIEWAGNNGVKYWVTLGDISHAMGPSINKDVIRAAVVVCEEIKERGIRHIILPGNHDLYQGKTVFRTLRNLAKIIVEPETVNIEGIKHAFIPYMSRPTSFVKALDDAAGWSASVLCCHQLFMGFELHSSYTSMEGGMPIDLVSDYKYVVAGHIHTPQVCKNVTVVGAPYHMDHGDSGDRGFYVFDGKDMKFIPVDAPKFYTKDIHTEEELENVLGMANDRNDYYHLLVDSTVPFAPFGIPTNVSVTINNVEGLQPRIQVENKSDEQLIKEVIEQWNTPLDKNRLLKIASTIWEETLQ